MLQYVVIDQIHFNTSYRGAHIRRGGLISWCIFFCLRVDGPITGGLTRRGSQVGGGGGLETPIETAVYCCLKKLFAKFTFF